MSSLIPNSCTQNLKVTFFVKVASYSCFYFVITCYTEQKVLYIVKFCCIISNKVFGNVFNVIKQNLQKLIVSILKSNCKNWKNSYTVYNKSLNWQIIFSMMKMIKFLSMQDTSILRTVASLSYLEHGDQVFVEVRDDIRTGHRHGVG